MSFQVKQKKTDELLAQNAVSGGRESMCSCVLITFTENTFTTVQTLFNIDINHKCVLSSKSAYYYDFWRSCDTEDWSNDAENTALISEINNIFKYIQQKTLFNCNNI